MPELPEVETIRQDLRNKLLGKKISRVLLSSKAIINVSPKKFKTELENKKIIEVERIGKLLMFVLDNKEYLLVHLKMTGQLIYSHNKEIVAGGHPEPGIENLPNKFTRITLEFSDKGKLYFNDIRRFGYMRLAGQKELDKIKSKYGPEPNSKSFTFEYFKNFLEHKNKAIKVALLDQDKIAGIGNIYASEICFEAKVLPNRKASTLKEKEIKALWLATNKVIKIAIKNRGTTFSDYVDAAGRGGYNISFLKVYDRVGLKCKRQDGGVIKKIELGGRGSFYCPKCQK